MKNDKSIPMMLKELVAGEIGRDKATVEGLNEWFLDKGFLTFKQKELLKGLHEKHFGPQTLNQISLDDV